MPLERPTGQGAFPADAFPADVLDGSFDPAQPRHDGEGSSERRKLVVTGLAAAVVALFIGWALGRSGADGSTATDEAGTRASEPPVTTVDGDELGVTVPTLDPALFPSPTVPTPTDAPVRRTTTTTDAPTWSLTQARVQPQAAALAIRIVGVRPDGEVVELDTATGELASFDEQVEMAAPQQLWAWDDWILANGRNNTMRLFPGRQAPESISGIDAWSLHIQPGTERFWVTVPEIGQRLRIVEVTADGTETGLEFDIDGRYWVVGSDPAGGLVLLGAPGGSYRVTPEGTSRIATGDVIAVSAQVAVAADCGESMQPCGLVVVDRSTGESRSVVPTIVEPTTGTQWSPYLESPAAYGFPALISGISPDGRYSPIMLSSVDQDYGLVDLVTGEFIQLGDYPESALWWAPDSRSAMYIVNGHLMVYETESRNTYEVSPDVFPLAAFTVRQQTQPAQ
jgi:hypothetical protein